MALSTVPGFYHEICMIKGSFVYYEEKREALIKCVVECVVLYD